MTISEIQRLVCESGQRLQREGLVAGTWGNISQRIDSDWMAITPSGISYEELTPDNIVIANIHDLTYKGNLKPSAEISMHAAILKNIKEVNAVIHNHSLYASIVAAKGLEVPPYIEDMAQVIGASVRIVEHALTGSPELSEGVVKALDNRYAAILQNHGAVCIGRDMKEAFAACHILEKSCQIFINIQLLGGGKALSPEYAEGFRDYYLNHYQKK
jgi:L-fuculose-phosphate aldolase